MRAGRLKDTERAVGRRRERKREVGERRKGGWGVAAMAIRGFIRGSLLLPLKSLACCR